MPPYTYGMELALTSSSMMWPLCTAIAIELIDVTNAVAAITSSRNAVGRRDAPRVADGLPVLPWRALVVFRHLWDVRSL